MFAVTIKLLTLITFTVHAVLGCCAHHQHHPHSESCHASVESSTCDHSHAHPGDCGDVAESTQKGCCHDGVNQVQIQRMSESSNGSPCDGSHDCQQPRCNYVSAPTATFDAVKAFSGPFAFADKDLTVCQLTASANSSLLAWLSSSSPPLGSRCCCTFLQSWQI